MNETDLEDVVEFDLSSEDQELSDKVGFLIEGVLIPILAALGIVGKSQYNNEHTHDWLARLHIP